ADIAICADPCAFAIEIVCADFPKQPLSAAAEAHAEWLDWATPKPREGVSLDLAQCVLAMREALPADTIICNGAGNFSG
ncbi:hypothetical protein ABTH29_20600, partial [Acinetobacter baumannii]